MKKQYNLNRVNDRMNNLLDRGYFITTRMRKNVHSGDSTVVFAGWENGKRKYYPAIVIGVKNSGGKNSYGNVHYYAVNEKRKYSLKGALKISEKMKWYRN